MKRFEFREREPNEASEDRDRFIEGVETTRLNILDVDFEQESAVSLSHTLLKTGRFLLGETHGVKENCDIILTLFQKFGFRNLALEWSDGLQRMVDTFLETNVLDFKKIEDSCDGRITAGHFALLKKLKENCMLDSVLCFDGEFPGSWNKRDLKMAQRLLKPRLTMPMLIIAGGLHAQTEPFILDHDKSKHIPMGSHLRKRFPLLPSGNIDYLSGGYHNIGVKQFETHSQNANIQQARFYQTRAELFTFELPKASPATVPNPRQTE